MCRGHCAGGTAGGTFWRIRPCVWSAWTVRWRPAVLVLLALVLGACGSTSTAPRTPSTISACAASQLSVSGSWQGATGSLLGGIDFTNTGHRSCSVAGYLRLTLLDQQEHALAVQLRHGPPAAVLHPPATPTPVDLPAGKPDAAFVVLQWFNWCGAYPGTVSVEVELSSGATLHPAAMGTGGARCDDALSSSFVTEGPVQVPPS